MWDKIMDSASATASRPGPFPKLLNESLTTAVICGITTKKGENMKSVSLKRFAGLIFGCATNPADQIKDVCGTIAHLLANGEAVNLPGVGKLEPVTRKATTVTLWGREVDVPERIGVKFRASAGLKKKLNP